MLPIPKLTHQHTEQKFYNHPTAQDGELPDSCYSFKLLSGTSVLYLIWWSLGVNGSRPTCCITISPIQPFGRRDSTSNAADLFWRHWQQVSGKNFCYLSIRLSRGMSAGRY
ncbi:hypothetical protein CDAR_371001 [Caerostris darwini]|uniref:Uncharacterized protein n=1 Tax=Caerostris darwini TaxID=1538125 RepID=A0AAV4NFV7_9ARAC|nr:hypothetical protein CDAR_371001 [Caerostris darwini]